MNYKETYDKVYAEDPNFCITTPILEDTNYKYAIDQIIQLGPLSILDIGAGRCVLEQFLPKDIEYIPADLNTYVQRDNYKVIDLCCDVDSVLDVKADVVLCLDVLENLTADDAELAMYNLSKLVSVYGIITIAGNVEKYHVNVQNSEYWDAKVKKYFTVIDNMSYAKKGKFPIYNYTVKKKEDAKITTTSSRRTNRIITASISQ